MLEAGLLSPLPRRPFIACVPCSMPVAALRFIIPIVYFNTAQCSSECAFVAKLINHTAFFVDILTSFVPVS